jgi:hypothetical protein
MKISAIKRLELDAIPSASGIEQGNGFYWIIGDNSPYLFQLDQHFSLLEKVNIKKLDHAIDGIIPKLKKVVPRFLIVPPKLRVNHSFSVITLMSPVGACKLLNKFSIFLLIFSVNKVNFL